MKDLFCAKCQKVTSHKGSVDMNGEFIFECQNSLPNIDNPEEMIPCDRFVKFPADIKKVQFEELIQKHEEVNTGQVTLENQEKTLEVLLGTSDEPSSKVEVPTPNEGEVNAANPQEEITPAP